MIVSCGEALVDFIPVPNDKGSPRFVPHPGGSPFNVAVALGRLGAPAGFFGGLSTDIFGEMLLTTLQESNVDTTLVHVSSRPSTLAFVTLEDGLARYAFYDENSAGHMLAEIDLPALPATVDALHFGSFSLVEEPCGSAFETLMQRERAHHVISLDLNIRPSLIKNRDGYLARLDRLVPMSDIVKLSEEDLAWLDGETAFPALAERWMDAGAQLVVLTRAASGARAISRHDDVTIAGKTVAVVDTVGAGDTFTAGFLAALHERGLLSKDSVARLATDAISTAMTFAVRASEVTTSRAGADPPWRRELA